MITGNITNFFYCNFHIIYKTAIIIQNFSVIILRSPINKMTLFCDTQLDNIAKLIRGVIIVKNKK